MNQKEKEILKIEESFKDTIENDLYKNNTQNKKIEMSALAVGCFQRRGYARKRAENRDLRI